MDIRQLRFLVALDETRHFGKAAQLCHVTQPTLSMRLNNLEEELGLTLVTRSHRFEGFTPEGERILEWAKTVLAAHDGLKAEAANCRGQLVGQLRLGTVPLAGIDPFDLISGLNDAFSALRFSLQTLSTDNVVEALNRNQLDLGLCYLDNVSASHFDILPFQPTSMAVVYNPNFFSWEQEPVSWHELSQSPLGMLSSAMHFRQSIILKMAGVGLSSDPLIETDSVHCLLQAVRRGLCCTIMLLTTPPASIGQDLALRAIADAQTISPLGLIMRKSKPHSPIARQCFDHIKNQSLLTGEHYA